MLQVDHKEACCGCHACAQICPRQCIRMEADEEGFLYPAIDTALCVQCGLCEKVCPVLQVGMEPTDSTPEAYAAYSLREDVRLSSSSGGIFSLLTGEVLASQGTVYGAAMTSVHEVNHIRVTKPEELPLLRGSKYVQSSIGNTYLLAREDLRQGKTVFFTGTPCQIEGLRQFLGEDHPKLICMDIVCHGVPSPTVWRKYVHYREGRAGSTAVRACFRNKKYGWKDYSVVIDFADGSAYTSCFMEDPFMLAYLHNLSMRPSCYQCRFRKLNRVSDITAADFWGIEHTYPQMDDDHGTSLLLVHSEKGARLLRSAFDSMNYQQVDLTAAIQRNPSLLASSKKPDAREAFLREIQTNDFRKVTGRYVKVRRPFKRLVKTALRRMGLRR